MERGCIDICTLSVRCKSGQSATEDAALEAAQRADVMLERDDMDGYAVDVLSSSRLSGHARILQLATCCVRVAGR